MVVDILHRMRFFLTLPPSAFVQPLYIHRHDAGSCPPPSNIWQYERERAEKVSKQYLFNDFLWSNTRFSFFFNDYIKNNTYLCTRNIY